MSYEYFSRLEPKAKHRYEEKLHLVGLESCPYQAPQGSWQNDPTTWPDLQWPAIYEYLINSPGVYTMEKMRTYKSLDAYIFFESGWVETVYSMKSELKQHMMTFRAAVRPSQRVTQCPHQPWVALNNEDPAYPTVVATHCTCMAGLGESCSHVGALMFKIEAAVRLGYTKLPCTSKPCAWNNDFVKSVVPKMVSEIQFYKKTTTPTPTTSNSEVRKRKLDRSPSREDKGKVLRALSLACPKAVGLSLFEETCQPFITQGTASKPKLPMCLREMYVPESKSLSGEELEHLFKEKNDSITPLSKDDVSFVNKCTERQSSSMTWHQMRLGRVTASSVHDILHTSLDTPAQSLIKKLCCPKTFKSQATDWGIQHENEALDLYKNTVEQQHECFTIAKSGLLLDMSHPFLGASPDSIVSCKCHGTICVEVKCPFKHRSSSLQDMLSDKEFCLDNSLCLKKNHRYYSQVQMQMYILDCVLCHFVVWVPTQMFIITVERDDVFVSSMVDCCMAFFSKHIIPELVTRKLEAADESVTSTVESDEPLFCICQMPDTGNHTMIGCDNPTCKYKWFHLDCLKRKTTPKGTWLCKYCKRSKK